MLRVYIKNNFVLEMINAEVNAGEYSPRNIFWSKIFFLLKIRRHNIFTCEYHVKL